MAKYDEVFKQALVQEYLSGQSGFRELACKHAVGRTTIRGWVDHYRQHGDAGLRKKSGRYSAQFKHSVLQHMWREDLSYRQTACLFELRGGSGVVSAWERQYHDGGLDALEPKPRGRPKQMTTPKPTKPALPDIDNARTLDDLRKENEYLRAEVAYLKKLDALVRAAQSKVPKKRK